MIAASSGLLWSKVIFTLSTVKAQSPTFFFSEGEQFSGVHPRAHPRFVDKYIGRTDCRPDLTVPPKLLGDSYFDVL